MKKILILLIAVCMLIPLCCGCKDQSNKNPTGTTDNGNGNNGNGEGDRGSAVSTLPNDLDFGNQIINIAFRDRDDIAFEIDPESNSVDTLNKDIAQRNNRVQDDLNVTIKFNRLPGTWAQRSEFITRCRANKDAGSSEQYDLIMGANYALTTLMLEGYFCNLMDADYLSLESPWWNGNFVDECSYDGKLYMVEGELMLTMIDSAFVMFVDTMNFRDASQETPDDLYEKVRTGNWTLAELETYVKDFGGDTNGDGVKDSNDTFGMVSPAFSCGRDGFPTAFGVQVTSKDLSTGRIALSYQSERNINIYDKFYDFLHNNEGIYINGNNDGARDDCKNMFQNGQVVFITELLNYAGTLRSLDRDYGIVPLPKYDTTQTEYSVASEAVHSQLSVTNYTGRSKIACAVAEDLCFLTYRDVTLDYFETVKYRNQKAPEVVEMLDLIISSITTNFGAQFSTEVGIPFPTPIGEVNNISGILSSQEEGMTTVLNKFKRKIQALDKPSEDSES